MTFAEAMTLVHSNPAGDGAVAVARPGWKGFVFYDATLFLGISPFGFRFSRSKNEDGHPWSFELEDVLATDWEVVNP